MNVPQIAQFFLTCTDTSGSLHPSAYVAGRPYQLCRRRQNMVQKMTTDSTSSLLIGGDQYSHLLRTVSYIISAGLVFSGHRTVAGTQRRTTDPNAYTHYRPHPAPPSQGPIVPQTCAAPVNPHPETSRQPGSASDRGLSLIANSPFSPLLDRSSAYLSCRRHACVLNEKD